MMVRCPGTVLAALGQSSATKDARIAGIMNASSSLTFFSINCPMALSISPSLTPWIAAVQESNTRVSS